MVVASQHIGRGQRNWQSAIPEYKSIRKNCISMMVRSSPLLGRRLPLIPLYVVRQDYGAEIATAIARRMVVPLYRDGGQAQYIETPLLAAPEKSEPSRDSCMGHCPPA